MRSFVPATVLLSALGLVACSSMPTPVAVPDAIKAPQGEMLAMIVPAKGFQVYECKATSGQFGWAFVAPDAELFDNGGRRIGKHYGGPTWESDDGSKVTGAVKGRADAPQAGAVPWLLLATTSAGAKGSFSAVTSIQRVNTVGGVAPAGGCASGNAGAVARVPYTADYYMLTKN
ncbi:MAG: DUF3455 domain-containing protein [Ferrovibrio sp.]